MKTSHKGDAAASPAPVPIPEPTHGGVYDLVNGQLVAKEGELAAAPAAPVKTEGEGA